MYSGDVVKFEKTCCVRHNGAVISRELWERDQKTANSGVEKYVCDDFLDTVGRRECSGH